MTDDPGPDWSSPHRIPLGYGTRPADDAEPSPEYLQTNIFTLAQIGGIYDLLAVQVERDHLELLTAWRLDSKAPSAVDYIRARAETAHEPNNE